MSKFLYLDFEFTGVANFDLTLICAAAICRENGKEVDRQTFWFWNQEDNKKAVKYFQTKMEAGYIFVAYVFEAECRSLMTLFGKELEFPGIIDLYLEYAQLTNANHKYEYGAQYIKGEEIVTTPPKNKWDSFGEDNEAHHKPEKSLASAVYKLLGTKIDTEHKDKMRDICISGEDFEIKKNRKTILEYCMSDVEIIVPLASAVSSAFQKEGFTKQKWLNCALKRGEYANASARMVRNGHPIDYVGLRSFQKNIPKILASAAKECNQSSTELVPFLFSKKDPLVVKKQVGLIKKWIEGQGYRNWPRTDKGHISLNRDAVSKFFNEDMPGFRGAIRRYASIEEAVKGFKKSKSKKSKDYFDFVGTDRRCRHKMGIYGSQTARSQHGATGFLPAKSRWMKICVVPEKGKAIVELDYSQQEFLIQAILSQDRKMIDAYASGDPYLTFAKTSGMAPISATKKSHKRERNIAKQLVLAVSYDMGPYSMAKKLTDSGIETSSQKAEELIERFYDVYNKYADWKWSIQDKYTRNKKLTLPDGWTLFGDQKNHRSVGNFPVQGMGSVILRESVKLAQAEGIKILYTMHDSITAEIDCYDFEKIETLKRCMIVGFANVMKGRGDFLDINIEGDAWSEEYRIMPAIEISGVKFMTKYLTEETSSVYEKYKEYFK